MNLILDYVKNLGTHFVPQPAATRTTPTRPAAPPELDREGDPVAEHDPARVSVSKSPSSGVRPHRWARSMTLVGALIVVAASCGGSRNGSGEFLRVIVANARSPVALTPLAGGGFLYAERLTGQVRRVGPDGRLDPQPVARVALSTVDQRGLLGLAIDSRDRAFGAFTRPDIPFALEVAELAPTPAWSGGARRAPGSPTATT